MALKSSSVQKGYTFLSDLQAHLAEFCSSVQQETHLIKKKKEKEFILSLLIIQVFTLITTELNVKTFSFFSKKPLLLAT